MDINEIPCKSFEKCSCNMSCLVLKTTPDLHARMIYQKRFISVEPLEEKKCYIINELKIKIICNLRKLNELMPRKGLKMFNNRPSDVFLKN